MKECIYVIEDDENIREIIDLALTSAGYNVKQFSNALDALKSMENDQVDLAVFDLMLPGISGIDAIKKIRETDQEMPILILSAKDREIDKVNGLDSGSDDYMTKPPDRQELVLRIKALLRRARIVDEHRITIGDVELDYDTHTVRRGHDAQVLPPKEFNLLYKLLAYPERTFTRLELLDSESDDKTVNVHINRLRTRFYDWPEFEIQTIRGIGYRAIKKV